MQEKGLFSDPPLEFSVFWVPSILPCEDTSNSERVWKQILSPVHNNAHEAEKFPFSHCNLPKFEVGENRPIPGNEVSTIYLEMQQSCTGFTTLKSEFWN
jgi:hypothetical protein